MIPLNLDLRISDGTNKLKTNVGLLLAQILVQIFMLILEASLNFLLPSFSKVINLDFIKSNYCFFNKNVFKKFY